MLLRPHSYCAATSTAGSWPLKQRGASLSRYHPMPLHNHTDGCGRDETSGEPAPNIGRQPAFIFANDLEALAGIYNCPVV